MAAKKVIVKGISTLTQISRAPSIGGNHFRIFYAAAQNMFGPISSQLLMTARHVKDAGLYSES